MFERVLVATDGNAGAAGALRAARTLADRTGGRVEVLTVHEPIHLYAVGSPEAVAILPEHYLPDSIEALGSRVRGQLAAMGGEAADWPVTVELGPVAPTIARVAARRGLDLIVLGLRQPGGLEEWFARETLLRLVHLAHVPVLAVPPGAQDLPGRAVVAVDFSEFSLRATSAALELLAPGGQLHLAHVSWGTLDGDGWTGWAEWERTYRAGVERRLTELATRLEPREDVTIHTHLLTGNAGDEILSLARRLDADLIATGSHGAGFFSRIVVGGVSSRVAHGTRCALLVVPPKTIAKELWLDLSDREIMTNLGQVGDWTLGGGERTSKEKRPDGS